MPRQNLAEAEGRPRPRALLSRTVGPWELGDLLVAAAVALAVALRWSDRAHSLQSWDANTFALSLERYDVFAHRPHAPGYPIYVAFARIVHVILPNANDALDAVSLVFTATAAIALYALGRSMMGRAPAIAATALLLADPVAYVHSVNANAYAAEMAGSVLVAGAAWRAHQDPRPVRLMVLAFALGIGVGVRPSLAFYLTPLAVWAALRPPWDLRTQVRRLAPALGTGLATCLLWFLPMIQLSGGYEAWSTANRIQGGQVVFARTLYNAGFPALQENLQRLELFVHWQILWMLPVAAIIVAIGLLAGRRPSWKRPTWSGPFTFFAVWLLPAILFFMTVYSGYHEGPSGYILVVLPGVLLAVCGACAWTLARTPWRSQAVAALATVALLVSVGGLAAHRYDVADVGYKDHDTWAEAWSHLPESFPPENSSIVALWNFAYVWENFPEYTSYNFRPLGEGPEADAAGVFVQVAHDREATPDWYSHEQTKDGPPHSLPNGTKHLVLFDFQLAGENGGPRRVYGDLIVREAFLPNGWRVLVVDTQPDRPNLEDYLSRNVVD